MNEAASKIIADSFLKGGFDVFEALLSVPFTYKAGGPAAATADQVSGALKQAPVILQTTLKGGGTVAILLSLADATKIVSLTSVGEPVAKDALDDADMGTLREIAEGVLGGGIANLSERFGEEFEAESLDVSVDDGTKAGAPGEFLGDGAVVSFTFASEAVFDAKAFLLHDAAMEGRVPDDAEASATVSDEEMTDILSGFTPDDEPDTYSNGSGNMDVILGIELIAKARLGNVEMPISEIMSLAPGAIIEVGHLVDEPVELLVNDKLIARGDVVVVDEKFGLRITEIVSQKERIESLR